MEESFKLPNAMRFLGRIKPATGRPVAFAGLREHIFSCYDGAAGLFMSQGEYIFAVMWYVTLSFAGYLWMLRVLLSQATSDVVTSTRAHALRPPRYVGQAFHAGT